MLVGIPLLDDILDRHALALGEDYHRYRNHAYRVANFYWHLRPGDAEDLNILAVAVAFHDLGIWTANTFDYLAPSKRLAEEYLQTKGMTAMVPLIVAMIDHHHQISAVAPPCDPRIDTFRRADWIDVSLGLRRFDLPRAALTPIVSMFPRLGFHWRLVRFSLAHGVRHPLRPLPMLRR